jgi:SEC-C motif
MTESVPYRSFREVLAWVKRSMSRGGGNWTVCATQTPGQKQFGLVAGAANAVRVPEGYILTLGFDRDKLLEVRGLIDQLLRDADAGEMPPVDTEMMGAAEALKTAMASTARNEPCPCGSGKKYKKCHGSPTSLGN